MRTLPSSRPLRRFKASILVILTGLLVFQGGPASGVVDIPEIHEELADFDSRPGRVQPSAEQVAMAEGLGAVVRWNRFGTPASLIRYGGYLAQGVKAPEAATAARSWLDANAELFGLTSSRGLALTSEGPLAAGAGYAVTFQRTHGSLAASPEGFVTVAVEEAGEGRWKVAYASSTMSGSPGVGGSFQLTAREAWVEAAEAVGPDIRAGAVSTAGTLAGWTRLRVEGFGRPQFVRGVAFPVPGDAAIRAYEATVSRLGQDGHFEAYRQIVDAESGEVLFRQNMVDHAADNPKWEVFPNHPPMDPMNAYPWNYPSDDTREVWCWLDDPGCQLVVANPAARVPWDVDARNGKPTFTTIGNAADSQEEWFSESPHVGPGPSQYQPTSPTRDYLYPWTNAWFENECDPDNFVVGSGNDIDAAAANLFAMHNRMHDWSYNLGFTEANWNAQDHNFGINPSGQGDELDGNVQAGGVSGGAPTWSGRDNAFMFTQPDGRSSITSMFLWQPIAGSFYAPCVDGDYDMVVIGHEYTHMIENRMIGKGVRRQGFHAGAMGESEADFTATEHLFEYGFSDDAVGPYGQWAVGPYVTGNSLRAIRNYNMAFPAAGAFPQPAAYPQINPLNFGAVGYDFVGPQVHADGEIWSATNFDIRELFLDRYPAMSDAQQRQCADGELPVDQCPGNRRWIQLVFDAYLLAPVAPTFLDMRDAILAADVIRFGGANQDLLWTAFARRGFGENASATGPQDTEPIPDFESPIHDEASVVFDAIAAEGGSPVSARIYVGHYEARVSPIADTNPATTGAINLDATARFLPDEGTNLSGQPAYEFVAHAPGYGHVRFRLDALEAGETLNVTIRFPTNHASQSNGAAATGNGARHGALIDDTEGSNWESTGAPVQGRQVVVQLPGPRTLTIAKVSAMLLPGQNRFTALRSFELYTCNANPARPCDPATPGVWRLVHRSDPAAFPADNPRPVAPHLVMRTFNLVETRATHVLFRVLSNQCTGQTSFQGEQDNDPNNQTDCRTGSPPLPRRDTEVRAAELELFTGPPTVTGAVAVE